MDLKYKVRTYNFWISLAAAILIILRLLGQHFGFSVDSVLYMDISTAVCGVLVILGIIIMPTSGQNMTKADKNKTKADTARQNTAEDCQKPTQEDQEVTNDGQKETEDELEVPKTGAQATNLDNVHPNLLDMAGKEQNGEIGEQENTEQMIREAIERLANDPKQLYAIIEESLKSHD